MSVKPRQSGVTLWGMFSIAFLVVIFALLLFKLIPPYLEDLKISSALNSLQHEAQTSSMTKGEILDHLQKRFDINEVDDISVHNDVVVQRNGRMYDISISYERQVPLVLNISALMTFNHSVEVPSGD